MVKDLRGHEVPAGGDAWAYREDMEQLSRTVNDVVPVASEEERAALISELAASEDGVPAIVLVQRADAAAGAEIEYTTDSGQTWTPVVGNAAGQALTHITPAGTAADPPSKYPIGVSLMQLTAEEAAAGAWPDKNAGQVLTIKSADGTSRVAQFQFRESATKTVAYTRSGLGGDGEAWAPWLAAASPRTASGSVTISSPGNGSNGTTTVAFPTGLFAEAPTVITQASTSAPRNVVSGATGVSATSATVVANRADNNGATPVMWVAMERMQ